MDSLRIQQPKLIQLKDLMPLYPWKTSPLPLSKLRGGQYMKLKEPIFKDGVKVYWQHKYLEEEAEDLEFEIPYEGVFKFIDRHVVNVIKKWIHKLGHVFRGGDYLDGTQINGNGSRQCSCYKEAAPEDDGWSSNGVVSLSIPSLLRCCVLDFPPDTGGKRGREHVGVSCGCREEEAAVDEEYML
ncbi:tyrosine kinase family protein [Sesbania bispinosa]|nr:tyrosine kinase family protein [Sesbania bispinosa]